jgi:predicted molibdopterin-dependent oxidoreductase YjgC
MLDAALEGRVKAMYIMGENPTLSDPDSKHAERALSNLEFLLVQDIFLNETGRLAHLVLPAACFAEKDGTFTNTERRVQMVRRAVPPPGRAKADWEIISLLSAKMGYPMRYPSPRTIMEEITRLTPIYAGVSYGRLQDHGLQWPCPSQDHPGTRILHRRRFSRGRGVFHPSDHNPPAEPTNPDFPFALTTGRLLSQFHTGTMTRRSPTLEREAPECQVEINPKDALSLNIRAGQLVRVTSRRGSIRARALVTDNIREKTVFIPFHYAEAAANILTNPAIDPISKIPEYKVCAVRIERCD